MHDPISTSLIYNFHFKLQYSLNNNRIDTMHNEIIHYDFFVEKYTELNFDNIFINNAYHFFIFY